MPPVLPVAPARPAEPGPMPWPRPIFVRKAPASAVVRPPGRDEPIAPTLDPIPPDEERNPVPSSTARILEKTDDFK